MTLPPSNPTPPQSPPAISLDYAARPRRARKWLFRLGLTLMLAGVAIASLQFGPRAWRQAQLLYWQRQCMNYVASPDQVVYEENRSEALRLIHGNQNYSSYLMSRSGELTAAYCPPEIAKFATAGSMLSAFPIRTDAAIAFLHERVSPSGHRRLVYVTFNPGQQGLSSSFVFNFDLLAAAIQPTTLRLPPKMPMVYGYRIPAGGNLNLSQTNLPRIRVYAGQCDPNDASHFTIRYEMWGQTDTVDGWLDDQEKVAITLRNPPKAP